MNSILLAKPSEPRMDQKSLTAMFRFRHKVFRERLEWEVKSVDAMEIDSFDELDPFYMISRNRSQEVEGCWRLLPTTGPYMLRDTFPELLRGEPAPNDPAVWELSRFAVESPAAGDLAQACLSPVTFAMIKKVYDFAKGNRIAQYVTVTSVALERLLKRLDLPISRFGDGKAMRIGKVLSVACRVEIDEQFRRVVYPDVPAAGTNGAAA